MKKLWFWITDKRNLLLVLALVMMFTMVAADAQDGELNDAEMYIITFLIAPVLAEVWKIIVQLFSRAGRKVGKFEASLLTGVVSVVCAFIFGRDYFAGLPPFGDEFLQWAAWVNALILALAPFIGLATIIYNLLWDRVFDGLANRFATFSYRLKG